MHSSIARGGGGMPRRHHAVPAPRPMAAAATGGGGGRDCIVGTGDLDLVGFLQALRETGFKGYFSLEYESAPQDPVPAMAECLANIRAAISSAK